ncbi:MAG: hypothetical protein HUK11_05775 [Muribaculaceae bacterium]|mgnify:FL=1|nr:hypothetical protein [Muribaculaceae bacterium]
MKKLQMVLSLVLFGLVVLCAACGNDEPGSGGDSDITRPKDGDGKVFGPNGVLIEANIYFTAAELQAALAATEWKRDHVYVYDNHHVGDAIKTCGRTVLPSALHTDGTYTAYQYYDGKMTLSGKEMYMHPDPLSSTSYFNNTYNAIALDYTSDLKRLIIDRPKAAGADFYPFPDGFKEEESSIRIVLVAAN